MSLPVEGVTGRAWKVLVLRMMSREFIVFNRTLRVVRSFRMEEGLTSWMIGLRETLVIAGEMYLGPATTIS